VILADQLAGVHNFMYCC